MAEYVDKKAAYLTAEEWFSNLGSKESLTEAVNKLPTIHIVRCSDCIRYEDGFCMAMGVLLDDDFFCAGGERKEE